MKKILTLISASLVALVLFANAPTVYAHTYSGYPTGNGNSYYYPYYSPEPYQPYYYPTPNCTISYSYGSNNYNYNNYNGYTYGNQPITLSWSANNATSAYISPSLGSVATNGGQVVYPSGSTTYTLTVYGPGGSNTCQTTYYAQNYYNNYNYNYSYQYPYTYYYTYPQQQYYYYTYPEYTYTYTYPGSYYYGY